MRTKSSTYRLRRVLAAVLTIAAQAVGQPARAIHGTLTGDGSSNNPYYIMDLEDWGTFSSLLNDPSSAPDYCDKHYRLGADIGSLGDPSQKATTWTANDPDYPFCGSFDGQGHTIYIDFTLTSGNIDTNGDKSEGVALFHYVGNGCDIHDLTVNGTISSDYKFVAGFVSVILPGEYDDPHVVSISRCRSHVTFNLGVNGNATSGGFVALSQENVLLSMQDCLFDGGYSSTTATHCSGMVGYQMSNGYCYNENCYVSPNGMNLTPNADNRNLCRYDNRDCFGSSNCYYSGSGFGDDQGEYVGASPDPASVAGLLGHWVVSGNQPVPMTVSQMAINCSLVSGFNAYSCHVTYNANSNSDENCVKLVDGDRSTKWCVSYPYIPYIKYHGWNPIDICFSYGMRVAPKGYILTTSSETKEHPDRLPKVWNLYGWNESTGSWDLLDRHDGGSDALPSVNCADKLYLIKNDESITTTYSRFKFEIEEITREDAVWDGIFDGGWNVNESDIVFELGEIRLLGVIGEVADSEPTQPSGHEDTQIDADDETVWMPTQTLALDGAKHVVVSDDVTTFKVYDDGGPDAASSANSNGMMLIEAPDNQILEFSGRVDFGRLTIYDGNDCRLPMATFDAGHPTVNKVTTTGNQAILLYVGDGYDEQKADLDLTVKVLDADGKYDIAIGDVTGGTVTIDDETTAKAAVNEEVNLVVEVADGYLCAGYTVSPDCNSAVTGGVWHESPDYASFVMPAEDITITPSYTNTLTAEGGLYINMPQHNHALVPKVVEIPAGVTSFKVYDDGGASGRYSCYSDGCLVLTAPDGYHLRLSGTVTCQDAGLQRDYLKVFDGDGITCTPLGNPDGLGNSGGLNIGTLTSSGRSMTLCFHTGNNSMAGLDLLVEVTNEFEDSYTIAFDDTNVPAGCSIGMTGTVSVDQTITVEVTCDESHLLNAFSVVDANGNEVALSNGLCWYDGNNTATFTMLPRNLFVNYEFVEKGDQYIRVPKNNTVDAPLTVNVPEGITTFMVYDDGGADGSYSNGCDGYVLLTAPESKAWQLTGTVKSETGKDFMMPYNDNTAKTLIDGRSYGNDTGEDIGTLVTSDNQMLIYFHSDYATTDNGLDLTATVIDPITIHVDGYTNVPAGEDRWTFITFPVKNHVLPQHVDGLFPEGENNEPLTTSTEYDLYRFDQSAALEWENYKIHTNNFAIENGNGYLYATKYARNVSLHGSINTDDSKEVPLDYDADASMAGYNLVGNPLAQAAYVDRPYYKMNTAGNGLTLVENYWEVPVPVCGGIVVQASGHDESVTFTRMAPEPPSVTPAPSADIPLTLSSHGSDDDHDAAIILASNADNADVISSNTGSGKVVILQDRMLWKDGYWNTLCLPFDVDLSAADCPLAGEGMTVMALDGDNSNLTNGTLTLNFTTVYDGNANKGSLVAGTPYIIKWVKDTSSPTIVDPVFTGVTIDATRNDVEFTGGKFVGTYDYLSFTTENQSILFLGGNNTLYWPKPDLTSTPAKYPSIGAFRAYFDLGTATVREFRLNFGDDEATGVTTTDLTDYTDEASAWYDLQGRKLQGQPAKKGIYIRVSPSKLGQAFLKRVSFP